MKRNAIGFLVLITALAAGAVEVRVDFTRADRRLRPALHSSGLGGQLTGPASARISDLKPLHLYAARTHDWALCNPGQRMLDTYHIFPLLHADADDPRNYFFGPTDEILKQTVSDLGIKVMYRMGTSIESVNARRNRADPSAPKPGYYNSVEPSDWEQYVKALSHIIRHYTKGWAGGYDWGGMIPYWELWNEPNDRPGGSWLNADGDFDQQRNYARYRKFFVYVMKRLKAEFPDLKFGGPSVSHPDYAFVRGWLEECKAGGYTPDFLSWHNYGCRPEEMLSTPEKMRALCDELGFKGIELVINEWHYITSPGIWGDFSAGPERYRNIINPDMGLKSIESAVYTLQVITGLQRSCLDQSYFYGCGHGFDWNWGIRNFDGSLNKVYYALKAFGTVVADCDRLAAVEGYDYRKPVQADGYLSRDGRRKYLVVSRFKDETAEIRVSVRGLEGLKCVSCLALDAKHDLEEVGDAFVRKDGELVFTVRDPASFAYLLVFE